MPKTQEEPGAGWFDKQAFKNHVSYPQNPVHAIGELNKLVGVMQASLPKISVPVQLIHSRDDDYVVKDSMVRIYEDLTTQDKHMLWIEGSGHVITSDSRRDIVAKTASDFVHRISV